MLRDKEQLIKWLIIATQGDIVICTALRTGRIVHLGVHDPLPSSERQGWVVKITTRHGHDYYLAVPMDQFGKPVNWYEVGDEGIRAIETKLPRRSDREPRGSILHPSTNRSPGVSPICPPMDALRRPPKIVAPAAEDDNDKVVDNEKTC